MRHDHSDERWPLPALHTAFLRHGETTGNILLDEIQSEDPHVRARAERMIRQADSRGWSHTALGERQVAAAGKCLRDHQHEFHVEGERPPVALFDAAFASPLRRAQQSKDTIGYVGTRWVTDPALREREWGILDSLGRVIHRERHSESYRAFLSDPFRWRPQNGESIESTVRGRVTDVHVRISDLHPTRALIVCHGDILWSFRYLYEGMTIEAFREAYHDPSNNVVYAQITHYTRVHPETKIVEPPGIVWMRAIDPMKPETPRWPWRRIQHAIPNDQPSIALG